MTNKLRVELFNVNTQTWIDATTDAMGPIEITNTGLQPSPGSTSPRGEQAPAIAKCKLTFNNSSLAYNPSQSGLLWARTPVRIRGSGPSLGYCAQLYVTGSQDGAVMFQHVINTISAGDVFVLTWQARANFDYQYNTDNVYLNTSAESPDWNLIAYTNKWATYTISFTPSLAATYVNVIFQPNTAPGTNASTIEYRNISLSKNGGANLLTNGDFASGVRSPWSPSDLTPVSNWTLGTSALGHSTRLQYSGNSAAIISVVPDTWILFNGLADTIEPQAHQRAGPLTCKVTALGMAALYHDQNLNTAPQINQGEDQVISRLFSKVQPGLLPGKQLDASKQTFPYVFDGYTYDSTKLWDAGRDLAMSGSGRFFIDRDGTTRYLNREALINAVTKAPKLTLTDGIAYVAKGWLQTKMLVNRAILTTTPRLIGTAIVQLAQLTATIPIPPTGVGGTGTDVTLTFVDSTGKIIGGANVYPPIFTLNDKADGSGIDYTVNTAAIYLSQSQVMASQVICTFINTTNQTLYLTSMSVSGNTVTTNNPVQRTAFDTSLVSRTGDVVFSKTLPYCADPSFAQLLAQYYINQYKTPFFEVDSFSTANKNTLNGTDVLSLDLFDVVSASDIQLGISNMLHAIVNIDYVLDPGAADYVASASFRLERLDSSTYWILGDSTYGVLGSTSVLYI